MVRRPPTRGCNYPSRSYANHILVTRAPEKTTLALSTYPRLATRDASQDHSIGNRREDVTDGGPENRDEARKAEEERTL